MPQWFAPNWSAILGLGVTVLLGSILVRHLVKKVGDSIKVPAPSTDQTMVDAWGTLMGQATGGALIGFLERLIFFAAAWVQGWLLITGWLVFKLAFYWQGANFTAFPEKLPDEFQMRWLVSKRTLGTHYVATALVGTAANIVVALIGVAVGKWIKL
jgi:hypothetical protein